MATFTNALAAASVLSLLGSVALANTPPPAPSSLTVHIKNYRYDPTPAKIHVGDQVTFVNDDDEAHTVTSSDKTFDSEGLDTKQTWRHVFSKPGTYTYFCELHPYMKAVIVVVGKGNEK